MLLLQTAVQQPFTFGRHPKRGSSRVSTGRQDSSFLRHIAHSPRLLCSVQRPTRLAETVLCVPEGLVTVPVRLSKGVLDAATGEVVDTEKLLLPSMLTAALGARPKKLLALQFTATGCEGLCYAMWIRADSVPGNAASIMADTVQALPAFLTSRVQAMSTERLSRRFDAILKRMPQGVVFIDDGLGPCLVNPAAADLLNLPTFGELDPVKVAATMHELAARSDMRAEVYRWFNAVAGYVAFDLSSCLLSILIVPSISFQVATMMRCSQLLEPNVERAHFCACIHVRASALLKFLQLKSAALQFDARAHLHPRKICLLQYTTYSFPIQFF